MSAEKKDKGFVEQRAKISIQEIILIESVIKPNPQKSNDHVTKLHFSSNIEFKVHEDQELLVSSIRNLVQTHDKVSDLAVINVACVFKIPNLKEYVENKEAGALLNEELIDSLSKITISTSRGVMYEKLRGTYLHQAVLPLLPIDFPSQMIPKKEKSKKKQGS